jgi:hypothetical protein
MFLSPSGSRFLNMGFSAAPARSSIMGLLGISGSLLPVGRLNQYGSLANPGFLLF